MTMARHKVSVCHDENGAAVAAVAAAALKCLLIYVSVIKLKYESLKFHSSGTLGGRARLRRVEDRRKTTGEREKRRRGKIYAAQPIFQKAANNHCGGRSSSLARSLAHSLASAILMSERTSEARIINMNFFIAHRRRCGGGIGGTAQNRTREQGLGDACECRIMRLCVSGLQCVFAKHSYAAFQSKGSIPIEGHSPVPACRLFDHESRSLHDYRRGHLAQFVQCVHRISANIRRRADRGERASEPGRKTKKARVRLVKSAIFRS